MNHISRFRLLNGAAEAIQRLNAAQLPVIVVTNQSGAGRGYFPEHLVHEIHERLRAELAVASARVGGVYYCRHVSSDNCQCRKPKPGMLLQSAVDFALDLKQSFVVGDPRSDTEVAHAVGAKSVLVRTGYGEGELAWHVKDWPLQPEFVAADLPEAVHWILRKRAE